jgi:hypothetical protein
MAKTTVALELEVSSKAAESSVGSFKKQLRDANQELLTLNEKFGATSKEAIAAAKKVANLKDAIGDAKQLSEAFNPDAKFNALAGAVTGAVSGFQALQGAQALFGTESKELEETLVKLNSVMALSQGLNGILAAKDSFKALAGVVKDTLSTAFGTLRKAIISTGIGALAIAVGLLIANFEQVKNVLTNLIPGLGKVFDGIGKIVDKAKEWLGVSKEQLDTVKAIEEATSEANEVFSKQFAEIDRLNNIQKLRAKIAGATQEQLEQIDLRALIKKRELVDGLIKINKDNPFFTADDTVLQNKRLELSQQIEAKQLEQAAAAADKRRAQQDKADEKEKERLKKLEDFKLLLKKQSKEAGDKGVESAVAQIDALAAKEEQAAKETAENKIFWEQFYANLKLQSDAELLKAEQDAAAQRVANLQSVADSTNKLADVVGKQTAVGKALASATALINTYQGATEVLRAKSTLPEPFGTISKIANVAAIIATGLKAVKSINSVRVPGSGGGGSVAAPSLGNFSPQATTTNLNQQSINAIGNVAARAYVLETDVSGNQERIRRLNRAARIN